MFYLANILVYPDNSYLLFIRPDYQQVPGGGGSEGYHIVSFSPSCLLLLVCSYSCGIHSTPISFHPLHRSQKPRRSSPHRPAASRARRAFPRSPRLISNIHLSISVCSISVFCQVCLRGDAFEGWRLDVPAAALGLW